MHGRRSRSPRPANDVGIRVPRPGGKRPLHCRETVIPPVAVTERESCPAHEQSSESPLLARPWLSRPRYRGRSCCSRDMLRAVQALAGRPSKRLARTTDALRDETRARRGGVADRRPHRALPDHDGDAFLQAQLPARPWTDGWPDKLTTARGSALRRATHGLPTGRSSPTPQRAHPSDLEVGSRRREWRDACRVREGMFAFPGRFSPDGSSCWRSTSGTTATRRSIRRPRTGETRELTPHDDDAMFVSGPWAPTAPASTCSRTRQRVPRARVLRPRIRPLRLGRGADAGRRRRHRLRTVVCWPGS